MSLQRRNIEAMEGYTPGEQPAGGKVIKLNTNENPYPPSPTVAAALAAIDSAALRRYPPPLATEFRNSAAALHGVSADHIIPTNGGDELLRLVLTTYVEPADTVVVAEPSYSLYPVLTDIQGCLLKRVPLQPNWQLADDFASQLTGAKLCILVNPHAPSGQLLSVETLAAVAGSFDGLLLVDEAYVDFVDPEQHWRLPAPGTRADQCADSAHHVQGLLSGRVTLWLRPGCAGPDRADAVHRPATATTPTSLPNAWQPQPCKIRTTPNPPGPECAPVASNW